MTIVFIFRDNSFSKFSGNCRGLPSEISKAVENSLSTLVLPCLQCREYLTDKDCLKCTNSEREIFSPLFHEISVSTVARLKRLNLNLAWPYKHAAAHRQSRSDRRHKHSYTAGCRRPMIDSLNVLPAWQLWAELGEIWW